MRNHCPGSGLILRLAVVCLLSVFFLPLSGLAEERAFPPRLIAHAGGAIDQQTYTNSLEALNRNYDRGFRLFELDFSWTADGQLVAIHDWQGAFKGKFLLPEQSVIPTAEAFVRLKMKGGLTQLGLKDALLWAQTKGDAYIVTDVKERNLEAIRTIDGEYASLKHLVIPQVYSYDEYREVRKLGYDKIILTLYRMRIDPYELIVFAQRQSPFAVTMPWQIAESGLAYYLMQNQTLVYAHTINDQAVFKELQKLGVYGVYTDFLLPQR